MKRTLLYIVHQYHNRGGTEEHTKLLARLMGEHFRVFVAHAESGKIHLMSDQELFAIFPMDPWEWPVTPYRSPLTEASVDRLLKVVKPDLIHVQHFFRWPLGILDQLRERGVPMMASFHDYYPFTPDFTMRWVQDPDDTLTPNYATLLFGSDISKYLQRRGEILFRSLSGCASLVAPSRFLADIISTNLSREVRVIPHGIELFQREAKEVDKRCRFCYMGALIPQKGIETLLKAFEVVNRERKDAQLHVYGDGPIDKAQYPSPQFHGAYQQEDVQRITGSVDIGIIPSEFRETFSLTLSEFWQGGCPVLAADVGALKERVEAGVNGRVFKSGDVGSLVEEILWFLEHQEWREWEIPHATSAAEMGEEYLNLYKELLP